MVKYFVLGMIFLLVVEPILDTIVETIQTVFEALKAKISVYILLAWSLFTAMYSYTQK